MLSSTADIPSLRKAFGEGADLVITKPIQAEHLRRMLAAMESPEWKHKKGRRPIAAVYRSDLHMG